MTTLSSAISASPQPDTDLKLSFRGFQWDDLPRVVELYNLRKAADGLDDLETLEDTRNYYQEPGFDVHTQVQLAVIHDQHGQEIIIGTCDLEYGHTGESRNWIDIAVHPDYVDRVWDRFADHCEAELLRGASSRQSDNLPLAVENWTYAGSVTTPPRLRARGYLHARSFYRMRIDFDSEIEPVALPDGFEIRPFAPDQHMQLAYEAHQEAFKDHWGSTRTPFDEWEHWLVKNPHADLSLWQLVWDTSTNEIAAMTFNRRYSENEPHMAWVNVLGTRRPYRKQGLGYALLRNTFRLFQQRGFTSAGLGVDASSLTNAVALYERAGMRVWRQWDLYAKMMRGEWLSSLYGEINT